MNTVSKGTVLRALVLVRRNHRQSTYALFDDVLNMYRENNISSSQRAAAYELEIIVTNWRYFDVNPLVKSERIDPRVHYHLLNVIGRL